MDLQEEDAVVQGILVCSEASCRSEFPILDGIPLLLPNLREYVAGNFLHLDARSDLSEALESLLGDCLGPGSPFDVARQQLSSYGWDHWGDRASAGAAPGSRREPSDGDEAPGSVVRLLAELLELAGGLPPGPVLDLGCATGRAAFALAGRTGEIVLGADLNFPMLRLAATALRRGVARFPLRRVGLVYERREVPIDRGGADRLDFWLCDAAALPLPAGVLGTAVGLNLLDSVSSPLDTLTSLHRVLAPGGLAILTAPWDWSPAATPLESWIGGHSQRGEEGGAAEPALRRLLDAVPGSAGGFEIVAERESLPWRLRLHDRSVVRYDTYAVVARKLEGPPGRPRP